MLIPLTEQQEKRIRQDGKAIEDIVKYASDLADSSKYQAKENKTLTGGKI